jgi:hypothetical protein
MQNRYVGDIGDYLKLGILRALSPGFHLGVALWLYPDESHNRDGQHISYLNHPSQWRHFDPQLFDALGRIVSSGQRHVRALEEANVLPRATFASEFIPIDRPTTERQQARQDWLERVQRKLDMPTCCFSTRTTGWSPRAFVPAAPSRERASCLANCVSSRDQGVV